MPKFGAPVYLSRRGRVEEPWLAFLETSNLICDDVPLQFREPGFGPESGEYGFPYENFPMHFKLGDVDRVRTDSHWPTFSFQH